MFGERWFFGQRDCCSVIAYGWPAEEHSVGTTQVLKPVLEGPSAKVTYLPVVDPLIWSARPFKIISPMHQACLIEGNTIENGSVEVNLKDAIAYTNGMVCVPYMPEAPLIEVATRHGYWGLPFSFIKQVLRWSSLNEEGTIINAIMALCREWIPDCTDEDIGFALDTRKSLGLDRNLEAVLDLEYVVEAFDKEERKKVEQEIKDAKNERKARREFHKSVKEWKATSY